MLGKLRKNNRALSEEAAKEFLRSASFGHLATVDAQGQPYVVPLHFVYDGEAIYFHCGKAGHKLDNLAFNSKACFEVCAMGQLNYDADPCDTSTAYQSVVAFGEVRPLADAEKEAVLRQIVCKYFPQLAETPITPAKIIGTQVMKFTVSQLTGKFHS